MDSVLGFSLYLYLLMPLLFLSYCLSY